VLLQLTSGAAHAESLVMPTELADFARANGCSQLADFYDRPGMVTPPYVYGVLPGDAEDSAALWCQKAGKSDKPYALMIKAKDAKGLNGCPSRIEWWNFPAGLSIETRKSVLLSKFRYVDEPQRAGPSLTVPIARVIVNYYDGASDRFYCYEGRWLFNSKD